MNATNRTAVVALRDLQPDDLPRIVEIERASYSTPWRRSTFEGLLRRSDTDLIGATLDGRLVGYSVTWTILDQAELGNVAVAPDARKRGLGRMLVRGALRRAEARGARECYLEVRQSNATAQRIYRGLGFLPVGVRRRYYADPIEDAVVMRARLQAGSDNTAGGL